MPKSSRVAAYGPEYEQLLLRASSSLDASYPPEFLLPLASHKEALSLKSRVYAYFSALRKEAARADLVAVADSLSLRVDDSCLVFFRREDSWDAVAIRTALGLEKGFAEGSSVEGVIAPSNALSSNLAKLASIRERK